MSSTLGAIASCLVNAVWEITLIGGVGWLVSLVLKRMGPRVEHMAWVAVLAISTLLPTLPLLRRMLPLFQVDSASRESISFSLIRAASLGAPVHDAHRLPLVLLWAILALYLCSLLIFAVRLLRSLWKAAVLLRQARPISLAVEQEEMLRRCERRFSLSHIRILASPQVPSPVTLGFRNPTILLPGDFLANCALQDLGAALAHECAHMRRRDFKKNLLYEFMSLPFAFHPMIWMVKSHIARTREIVCDFMVTENLLDSRSYSESLLRLAAMVGIKRYSATNTIGMFGAEILEERIMRITVKQHLASPLLKLALIVPAALLLFVLAMSAAAMAVVVEPESASQVKASGNSYGHVYAIGRDVSAPVPLNNPEAKFPKSGKKMIDPNGATVLIRCIVDTAGLPREARVVRSYQRDFDAEAIKAVQKYRFKPAMRSGEPVSVAITVEINFRVH